MSQSFDLISSSVNTVQFNGADCTKIMLNDTRIWERYTAQHQVWVSSGYNSSSWNYIGAYYAGPAPSIYWGNWGAGRMVLSGFGLGAYWTTSYTSGNNRYNKGSKHHNGNNGKQYYRINKYTYQTSWVDTSAYQTQNYTAYYA